MQEKRYDREKPTKMRNIILLQKDTIVSNMLTVLWFIDGEAEISQCNGHY